MTAARPPGDLRIDRATHDDVEPIVALVVALLEEISAGLGERVFSADPDTTRTRLRQFLDLPGYASFLARLGNEPVGVLTLYESLALYAEGAFGTIAEFSVVPAWRGCGIGRALLQAARAFGVSRGWTRLEVTTPPLPAFARTLAFYEREGFAVSGGRKLRCLLELPR